MFEKFWQILQEKESLLDQSRQEALSMLRTCREMYRMVVEAIREELSSNARDTIRKTDVQINKQQRNVRKMVFEHLSMSTSADLLTGLQLLNIVIDIERIGDYTKNIADLLKMLPRKFDFGTYEKDVHEIDRMTVEIFNDTIIALEKEDFEIGNEVLRKYDEVAALCDKHLEAIVTQDSASDMVEKRFLALVLLFRYIKRVNAHMKNIATTLVNPFHKIGYRR